MDIKDQILQNINELNKYNEENNDKRLNIINKLSKVIDTIDFSNINKMNSKKLSSLMDVINTYVSTLNEIEELKIKQIKTKIKTASEEDNRETNRNIVEFIKAMNEKRIKENIGSSTDEVLLDKELEKNNITVTDEETSFDVNDIKEKLISELDE